MSESTPFSNFIRTASEDDKAKVYGDVMDRASTDQQLMLLQAENERLQNLVKKAYLDGWLDGHCTADAPDAWAENDWQASEARAALAQWQGRDKS
jgi:hypothetical protein